MFVTIFRFDIIFKKYLIKSGDILVLMYNFAQNTSLNKILKFEMNSNNSFCFLKTVSMYLKTP